MLEILSLGADDVVAYRAEGKIEVSDIERAFEEIDRKLAAHPRVRIYGEVHGLSGVTMHALWRDLDLMVRRPDLLTRVEKAALVTDQEWLRSVGSWQNTFLPGVQIRAFALSEQHLAQSWVRE